MYVVQPVNVDGPEPARSPLMVLQLVEGVIEIAPAQSSLTGTCNDWTQIVKSVVSGAIVELPTLIK